MGDLFQKTQEFDKAHETKWGYTITPDDAWRLFEDGSRRSTVSHGELGCEIREAQSGTKAEREWKETFWQLKLDELVNQFEMLKNRLSLNVGQLGDDEFESLRVAKARVRTAQQKLDVLQRKSRGYREADTDRARELWAKLRSALISANAATQEYENGVQEGLANHDLRKVTGWMTKANLRVEKLTSAWNAFEPREARDVVVTEQSEAKRQEQIAELNEIEV